MLLFLHRLRSIYFCEFRFGLLIRSFSFFVLIANRLSRSFVIVILSVFLYFFPFAKNIIFFIGSIDVTQNSLNLS